MDLRHLRTFVTVIEQGTVSKASQQLRTAQPALSRQIGDLEAELGVKLFDRIRRRLVLTGHGEQLLAECRSILNAVDFLREHAELIRRDDRGVLKIAATPQMIDGVFSNFLHRYSERFPDVEIKLTEAVGVEPFAKLDRGELHLAINYLQTVETEGYQFESFPLPPLDFLAVGHESLRLGSGGDVELARLAGHPLLLLDDRFSGVRKVFDAACRLAGIKPQVFVESRAPHSLLSLAEAGHGVAVIPSVLPTHRYRVRIARITYRRRPLRGLLSVLWDRRRVLPPYAKEFCTFLNAYMREVFPISRPTTSKAHRKAARHLVREGAGRPRSRRAESSARR